MIGFANGTVRLLMVLNWLLMVAFALIVAASFAREALFVAQIAAKFPGDAAAILGWWRMVLLLGIGAGVAADFMFRRLRAILATVREGDAFVAANGARLRQIGWSLLALQFLDLAFGWVTAQLDAATGQGFGWSFTLTGWLAALLVFVLAEVWREGATMRDDLSGTV